MSDLSDNDPFGLTSEDYQRLKLLLEANPDAASLQIIRELTGERDRLRQALAAQPTNVTGTETHTDSLHQLLNEWCEAWSQGSLAWWAEQGEDLYLRTCQLLDPPLDDPMKGDDTDTPF